MHGKNMQNANLALTLFIKSLPVGSQFEIISFGTDFNFFSTTYLGKDIGLDYNDTNVDQVINLIPKMLQANMQGTEIYRPLKEAYNIKTALPKRIFLLTDGEAEDAKEVLELATSTMKSQKDKG